jgi:nucleoside-diphosphate-sugar epimerase
MVHCAYDLSLTRERDVSRVNVEGTNRLVQATAEAGVRFVLISSMSAYPGTRQIYGRAKLAAESAVLAAGGKVVRLGLVYGDDGKGMIGALQRLVGLPITPLIARDTYQFTVHVNDMVRGVLRLATGPESSHEPVGLAHPRPVRFEDLLMTLAGRTGTCLRPFPVPWTAAYGAMRVAEALRLSLPLRADSILGLVRPAPLVPKADLWAPLGVRVRPFEEWAT